jgi:hypothetical protein
LDVQTQKTQTKLHFANKKMRQIKWLSFMLLWKMLNFFFLFFLFK